MCLPSCAEKLAKMLGDLKIQDAILASKNGSNAINDDQKVILETLQTASRWVFKITF